MLQRRTLIPAIAAALVFTIGASVTGGTASALAAGAHTQGQMMPGQMNPGMGMGMAMGGTLPIYTPALSGLLGMPSYAMPAPAYVPSSQYLLPASNGFGNAPSYAETVDVQQVCHQYEVALQYGTQADDMNLDQICGAMGSSSGGASASTGSGQAYP